MTDSTYQIWVGKERVWRMEISADFAQSASSISWRGSKNDDFDVSPLQVWHADHDERIAAEGINDYLGGSVFGADEDWRIVEVEEDEEDEEDVEKW